MSQQAEIRQMRANQLGNYRWACQNEHGIKDDTPEMVLCMQQLDTQPIVLHGQPTRRLNPSSDYFRRTSQQLLCTGSGGTFDYLTGNCTEPASTKSGTIYDNRGRAVGRFTY